MKGFIPNVHYKASVGQHLSVLQGEGPKDPFLGFQHEPDGIIILKFKPL